jgi:Resolvase, N terminal domain
VVAGQENGQIALAYVGYARVSTLDQDPALQRDALAAAGCAKVFEDRASGIKLTGLACWQPSPTRGMGTCWSFGSWIALAGRCHI